MIYPNHLRKFVIKPVLKAIGKYSTAAEELIMLTAAQESALGKYLHQLGSGPAKGIYQMEPFTHDDIWENFLQYNEDLGWSVNLWAIPSNHFENNDKDHPEAEQMIGNLYYATAMCRMHYLRVPDRLPEADDVEALAAYYKEFYNTIKGKATAEEAVENYFEYAFVE